MSKIILFSGVAGCGKDEAIKHLRSLGYPWSRREAKGKLHTLVQEFFCVSPERYWEIYNDRELKEKPLPEFTLILNDYEIKVLERNFGDVHIEFFQEHIHSSSSVLVVHKTSYDLH